MGAKNSNISKNVKQISFAAGGFYEGSDYDENGLECFEDRNPSKSMKYLEEKRLEEKCKKEIEDIENEKEIKENEYKFEAINEKLINNERGKCKKLKIFSLILLNLVLIFLCLVLFYFYFYYSGKKQKGSIECIYFYPGN